MAAKRDGARGFDRSLYGIGGMPELRAVPDVEIAWQRLSKTRTRDADGRVNYALANELEDQLRAACHAAIDSGTPEGEKVGIRGLEYLAYHGEHATIASNEKNQDGRFLDWFADQKRLTAETATQEEKQFWKTLTDAGDVGAVIEVLREACTNRDRRSAGKATDALEAIAAGAPEALLPGLEDEISTVRWACAELLGKFGSLDSVPALTAILDDSDEGVREAASVALERIRSRSNT